MAADQVQHHRVVAAVAEGKLGAASDHRDWAAVEGILHAAVADLEVPHMHLEALHRTQVAWEAVLETVVEDQLHSVEEVVQSARSLDFLGQSFAAVLRGRRCSS
jgi:hypothetical protein